MPRQCYYLPDMEQAGQLPTPPTGSRSTAAKPFAALAIPALVVLLLVIADQVTKWMVVRWIGPDADSHRFELAGAYLAFEYVENRGAAFGILSGRTVMLVILALLVAVVFYMVIRHELPRSPLMRLVVILIAAGAVGNLIDRIRLGHVVDFVAVGIWPKFNIADACISLGILLLVYVTLTETPHDAAGGESDAHASE